MCFGNQHTFTWGSTTGGAADVMPMSLRCTCGAMGREDIAPLRLLQVENAALEREMEAARECHVEKLERAQRAEARLKIANEALDAIVMRGNSPGAWAIADAALIQISVVE